MLHGGPSLPFANPQSAANRHPKATHQWLLIGVQACRLQALKGFKPLKTLQTLKTLTTRHGGPSLPFARPARPHINGFLWVSKPAVCQALNIPLACFILQPTGTPRPHINVFLWASKPAVCQPLNTKKPSKRLKPLQPVMGVQACRLPGLTHSLGMLHPEANRHPKATHQCLLMGVQACRLPALKRLKTLQTLKTLTTRHGGPSLPFARPARPHINGFLWASKLAVCQALNIPLACFILQPTGTPRPHINVFLWASKPAVCQPLNA